MQTQNNPIKILIVEDSLTQSHVILRILDQEETASYDVIPARDLKSAVVFCSEHRFDIILLDLNLPDSQGLECFLTLKKCVPKVPIVIVTTLDDKTVALEAVKNGAQDYLVKGKIDQETLVRSIDYAIERAKHQSN